jgi:hypothetical protein
MPPHRSDIFVLGVLILNFGKTFQQFFGVETIRAGIDFFDFQFFFGAVFFSVMRRNTPPSRINASVIPRFFQYGVNTQGPSPLFQWKETH